MASQGTSGYPEGLLRDVEEQDRGRTLERDHAVGREEPTPDYTRCTPDEHAITINVQSAREVLHWLQGGLDDVKRLLGDYTSMSIVMNSK